ncbi:DUF3253 domain-containing protein [Halpernia frigidisoli]|uniref:DUF3253 domain-containing protein n=1 Tax=Halpernia frigidisoli TaxID=1125876 RepID=A0A1I3CVP5_9FLAO|nr:DUF3253 domain-containing protein [Halpernia frigidisoli]SFH78570.1 Protein of unknown function [Halpernia frigidisoli]
MSEIIRNAHLKFAKDRGFEKTFCPSEVARELFPDIWREKMDEVRNVAQELINENLIEVSQKGEIKNQNISKLIGPIRLRLKKPL